MSQAGVVFVTGGASGIGRAVARRLAGEGSSVVVADQDVRNGNETRDLITAAGGHAMFEEIDVLRLLLVVDQPGVLVGHLLDIREGAPLVVFRYFVVLEQLLEGVVHMPPGVPDAVAALLG